MAERDWQAEYRAVREAAGLLDRSSRGRLLLTGGDRLTWLQGMVSNDVRPLQTGVPVVQACILNATGHLLADIAVVNRGDSLLLDMARENVEKVRRLLEGYLILEDVEIADGSDALACLSVQGPKAAEILAGAQAHPPEPLSNRAPEHRAPTLVPADHTGSGGFDLYLAAEDAPTLRERLVAAGAVEVGETAEEVLRIEAGIPKYGVDMDERTIPLEANLEATHISYAKGCYVGQEIIARIHARGHTNRALTGLVLEGATGQCPHTPLLPCAHTSLYPAQGETEREIGWVTSAAFSPVLNRAIALAYVRHEHRAPGTRLRAARADGDLLAVVTSLPFVGNRTPA